MDRSPGSIARLLTCVKDDLVNLKSYFEKWNSKSSTHGIRSLDQRDIEIEVKTLLTRFQHSLRDLLSTIPEWQDVDTITMAQQINQLAVGEMRAMKEGGAGSPVGAPGARKSGPGGGRDELYKCINQLACKIAERSLPLFMGETGSQPASQPTRSAVRKSPTLENASGSSRHSLVDESECDHSPHPAMDDSSPTPKYRDSPTGSASLNSPDVVISAAALARADPGLQQDNLLALRDKNAVDFIFNRGKNFSKYIFDYIKNEEKRITNEVEHIRALAKSCQSMVTSLQPNQTTQSNLCMPLQAHLINYSKNVSEKCREFESRNYAQCWDELEHLKKKNVNFDNKRKALKDQWKDQLKKTSDARAHHEKARSSYHSRCQTLEKLSYDEADAAALLLAQTAASSGSDSFGSSSDVADSSAAPSSSSSSTLSSVGPGGVAFGPLAASASSSALAGGGLGAGGDAASSAVVAKMRSKAEKLNRQRLDAEGRQREAEDEYRNAVTRLNEALQETEEQRVAMLRRARELNVDMEFVFKQTNIVIKKNELAMTQELQRLHMRHTEEMETYQPGSKYSEAIEVYIRPRKDEYHVSLVGFEAYHFTGPAANADRQKPESEPVTLRRTPGRSRYQRAPAPPVSLGCAGAGLETRSTNSYRRRPSSRPRSSDSFLHYTLSVSELVQLRRIGAAARAGSSHRSPPAGGSRDEDSLDGASERASGGRSSLYSGGTEYEDGTVGSMKTTLNEWASNIKNKFSIKSRRSGAPVDGLTEGMSQEAEVKHARYILSRCIAEIEERGLRQTGLYRCSASVKSIFNVMENLQGDDPTVVDLSDESIYTLCGVIKSALKGLSEPLLTFDAYPEFLEIGKEMISSPPPPDSLLVSRLVRITSTLPEANKMTCGICFHHLKKVASHSAENQMTAANLGTCLSPTLLKPKSARSTKADVGDMMDNPPRSRVIELLIDNVEEVFGPRNEYIPELDFSCSSPVLPKPSPVPEVPAPAPSSAPPIPECRAVVVAHPPAVRSSSDSATRLELWPAPHAASHGPVLRPGAVSSCSSRSSDSTDLLSASMTSSAKASVSSSTALMLHPSANRPASTSPVPPKVVHQAATEPAEIAFIDNDDSGEDLGHSQDVLSSSGSGAAKKNLKKAVINLFRKRKHEDPPTNGRLKPGTLVVGRSLEHLPSVGVGPLPALARPVERVASMHIPASSQSDDSETSSVEQRRPVSARDLVDSCSTRPARPVTRLGRTEGDGHSTPTSPVVTPRRQDHRRIVAQPAKPPPTTQRRSRRPDASPNPSLPIPIASRSSPQQTSGGSSDSSTLVRRSSPSQLGATSPGTNRIRRRLSDNFERSAEARALVRDRHRAANRPSANSHPVAQREHSCPASRERRRMVQSIPASMALAPGCPPKIRTPLEPRRAVDRRAGRCQLPGDEYAEAGGNGYGNLTPRRSHPEFV